MQINNSEVTKRFVEDGKISIPEGIPNELTRQIVPVLVVNPLRVSDIIKSGTANGGNTTLYTADTDKDFYITAMWVSEGFDSDTDGIAYITATVKGTATRIIGCNSGMVTSPNGIGGSTGSNSINSNFALKVDRGSQIVLTESGGNTAQGGFYGYYVDTLNKNAA